MKRNLIATILLLAALPAVSASDSAMMSFQRGSWRQLLHSHAGRPMLVHFWGVTCGPCKVELPQLGEFMKQHPAIQVMTIDADLVPNSEAAALAMLRSAGLSSAENWMFSDGFADRLRYEIDPAWQGEIPRTLLIAADGNITTIEGSAEPSVLEKWSVEQRTK